MHLLYLTFGENISNHIQAQFSILSFMVQKNEISTINVITDQRDFYTNLNDRINVIAINEETLKLWKGEYDFFWRIKIKALEMLCGLYKGQPVLYLDSDTFLFGDVGALKQAALTGKAFMHENEGKLPNEKSKTGKKMWQRVRNRNYGDVSITACHCMWNAGVVLTPNQKNNKECLLALKICDEMCKQGVPKRLIEQFALSVALQEIYGLNAVYNVIGHYWSNKESWNKVIEPFFITSGFKGLTTEQTAEAIKNFDFTKIPVKVRTRNTNTRLKALIDKLFATREISFADDMHRHPQ